VKFRPLDGQNQLRFETSMRASLLTILRSPQKEEVLTLHAFDTSNDAGEENIIEGLLVTPNADKAFPIVGGVPVMFESAFTKTFVQRHGEKISKIIALEKLGMADETAEWSFSSEWEHHFDSDVTTTWDWTVDSRARQFSLETGVDVKKIAGKKVFDAGCGNGELTEQLSKEGAMVVGLDFSSSVFGAERKRKSGTVHFVQGDLQKPPFARGCFDIIVSNGVLHHAPSTKETFAAVAELVAPEGRFYLWLYRKPDSFYGKHVFTPALETTRFFVSRLPRVPQKWAVKAYAALLRATHILRKKHLHYTWDATVVSAYDNITPMWRHYHTPLEVACWFFEHGYSDPVISHWDNPNGFGMVAVRRPQSETPGVNFEKPNVSKRYWD
jgi:SAM-dependent methyltransferase/uncharacterized protein YbaR (Trm112 family)